MKFFGKEQPPELEMDLKGLKNLAAQLIIQRTAVTGVQPKLSLDLEPDQNDPRKSRFAIVGLWGSYILKPPTEKFPPTAENEDLTMHLAGIAGIETAKHSLIRLASGELAYITKRFDRKGKERLPMEDMCQLAEKPTSEKYNGSMELVARLLMKYSSRPGFDGVALFDLIIFCFLTGNADMHLKNFSLLWPDEFTAVLSPAYDLLATRLILEDDNEETALFINGRKNKLERKNFEELGERLQMNEASIRNSFRRMVKSLKELHAFIDISFLPQEVKNKYHELLKNRSDRILY